MKLNVKACAFACAILWGLGLLLLTWWLILFGGAKEQTADLISQVYIGYSVTVVGSLVGLFWGFIDGLFGGFFFAWLYNQFADRFPDARQASPPSHQAAHREPDVVSMGV